MKKAIIIMFIMVIIYMIVGNVVAQSNIIPDDAIRIRVIPNSNSDYDQKMKFKVKESVESELYNLLKDVKDVNSARVIIKNNLYNVEDKINTTLQKEKYKESFSVNFGLNYFPSKTFKGITYKEGYYESVVITLGEGLGDNWWCVLFPPLCLLEAEESNDVEYTTMVKMIIDKYF